MIIQRYMLNDDDDPATTQICVPMMPIPGHIYDHLVFGMMDRGMYSFQVVVSGLRGNEQNIIVCWWAKVDWALILLAFSWISIIFQQKETFPSSSVSSLLPIATAPLLYTTPPPSNNPPVRTSLMQRKARKSTPYGPIISPKGTNKRFIEHADSIHIRELSFGDGGMFAGSSGPDYMASICFRGHHP